MLAEALKQFVDQPGLRQRLAKQPDRGGIRHWVLEVEIEKAHERYAVADQVLSPIVREIVERLQHQDLELQDRVIGLAAGVALALLALRLRHGLDVSTEILPWHDLLDRFQRIDQGADRLQPALNIEKARLPHDPLAPSAHDRARSPSQIRGDLARGIFRGALMAYHPLAKGGAENAPTMCPHIARGAIWLKEGGQKKEPRDGHITALLHRSAAKAEETSSDCSTNRPIPIHGGLLACGMVRVSVALSPRISAKAPPQEPCLGSKAAKARGRKLARRR